MHYRSRKLLTTKDPCAVRQTVMSPGEDNEVVGGVGRVGGDEQARGVGAVGGLPGKAVLSSKLKELGRKGMWSRGVRRCSRRQGSPQVPEAGGHLAVAGTAQGLRDRGRMSREEKGQEGKPGRKLGARSELLLREMTSPWRVFKQRKDMTSF